MKKIRSISRAVRILETFRGGASPTVTELRRSLKLPKSSVFEILSTLAAEGVVAKEEQTNRYNPPGEAIVWAAALTSKKLEADGPYKGDYAAVARLVEERYRGTAHTAV